MKIKNNVLAYADGTKIVRPLLVAGDGCALTNDGGATMHNCVAVDSTDGWEEIRLDPDLTAEEALSVIMGGNV